MSSSTTATMNTPVEAPGKMPKMDIGLGLILRTTVLYVAPAAAVLHYLGLFQTNFYLAMFLMSIVVDQSSEALSAIGQYVLPVYLILHLVVVEHTFPTVLQFALLMPTTVLLIGICMSVCLHRYFSHQAFQTTRLVQFIIGIMSCLAYQKGPLWWSAKHTRHHHFCDQPKDPHSVKQQGFWYAFLLWTVNPTSHSEKDTEFNHKALFSYVELKALDKFYLAPVALVLALAEHLGGHQVAVYSIYLPMLLSRVITLLFNAEFHPVENPKRCKSIDDPRFLALLVGENEHDVHHKKPALAKRGPYDLPYYMTLAWMEQLGLVWDLR